MRGQSLGREHNLCCRPRRIHALADPAFAAGADEQDGLIHTQAVFAAQPVHHVVAGRLHRAFQDRR